jgi:hypothetical protein
MGFTQEQLDRQGREMNQRLHDTYGEALKPAKEKFLEDPRTKAYLYNDSDRGITVDAPHPNTLKMISSLFCAVADPKPPYGQRGIDVFVEFVLHVSEDTPDGGESAKEMMEAMREHVEKLKDERRLRLN